MGQRCEGICRTFYVFGCKLKLSALLFFYNEKKTGKEKNSILKDKIKKLINIGQIFQWKMQNKRGNLDERKFGGKGK